MLAHDFIVLVTNEEISKFTSNISSSGQLIILSNAEPNFIKLVNLIA